MYYVESNFRDDCVALGDIFNAFAWLAPEEDMQTMALMRDQLPSNAVWASFGISRFEFPMVASAVVLGGHVRVGMEDNF